jgi:hypothetical protein
MRIRLRLPAAALALALLSSLGTAQDRAPATLKLLDGSSVTGNATRYDSDSGKLYFKTTDGRDLVFTKEELDVRSAYLLNRSRIPQDDASLQLQLANFARDAGLYAHSSRHYRYAAKADPEMKAEIDVQVAIMHQKAAGYCMVNLQEAVAAGNNEEATKWAKILLDKLPEQPEAQIASQMLDGLYAKSHDSRDDQLEEDASDLLAGDLKAGKRHYDSMLANNKKGLQTKSKSSSSRSWNSAIRDGERALKEIDKVAKKRTDAASQATLAGYRELVVEQIVATHLNLASQYMTRTSFNQALTEVNRALALDPTSESALSMRSRVETASSRGIGGWW